MDLEAKEKDKYRRIWEKDEYRINSPGALSVAEFMTNVPWQQGDTVVDFGCGTGRAARIMRHMGLKVWALDFCPTAIETPPLTAPLEFIEANLWDLPQRERFDWIFSADVLEHLPEEKVQAALDGMARWTRKGGYLQIACFEDGCGNMIGEKLHLTVHPSNWWYPEVADRWEIRKDLSDSMYARFVIGEPNGSFANRD